MSDDIERRAWTVEDIPKLRAAAAFTGFPCALRAIREIQKQAATVATEVEASEAA
jgi:hypothetical protein